MEPPDGDLAVKRRFVSPGYALALTPVSVLILSSGFRALSLFS